ncbi:acylphosphatase [Halalkalibaculum sp. DA384]|uniref:acylphosphatase n=1 Tax=Halalkalibaculum sp. DA384 TaxID=3373606 RepID=UPI003754AA2E
MKRAHIFIEGRVQGVGFRHFTKTNARQLGVNGWVKNLPDGRVEAVFEGEEPPVKKMVERVKEGPRASSVSNVEVEWETPSREFSNFRVTY